MKAVALTDVGKMRENNEDYFILCEESALYVITDGMGGYQAGEVAAEIAAKNIVEKFNEKSALGVEEKFKAILEKANEAIISYVKEHPECRGMGTTSVLTHFEGDSFWVVNVGDSRCYGIRDNEIIQLSEDHSLVAELVKIGSISVEEAEKHPDRNIITSALGVDRQFDIFIRQYKINDFTHIVLCSDGLSNMVSSLELLELIQNTDFYLVPQAMVDLANHNGGKDNITVICIEL
ncbi:MAG: hypothetical protein BGO41_14145 [Clostridiales bacterium 38-18]|nr:MAG: hypothetical protein BGO41_14145 [Clostridiales bacterium 38-18]